MLPGNLVHMSNVTATTASRIVHTLADECLTVFAGQTVTGEQIEAHTAPRYIEERGRRQTFGSYSKMIDALEAAGVTIDQPVRGGERLFTFPA